MPLTMSGFDALADRLADLAGIPSRMSGEVSEGLTELLREQFDGAHDPYEQAWKPLKASTIKRKGGDSRILRREDMLSSNTIAVPARGAGVELVSEDYGRFHQEGTVHMTDRPILPDGEELPESWQEVIQEAADNAFRQAMGGR